MLPSRGTILLTVSVLGLLLGGLRAQTATTQAATGVTDIAATLNGSVTPGSATTYSYCRFEYGTDTSYGSTINTDPFDVIGLSPVAVKANPPGLLPGTTYHYRILMGAITGGGIPGDDMTFTTGPAATLPSFQSTNTSIIGDTAANFDVWAPKSGGSAATLSVEYGLTAAYGSTLTFPDVMPVNTSQSFVQCRVTGLTPTTTYHWRLKMTNAQGTTYSADQTFSTLATPVVTTGGASGVTFNTATLSGTVDAAGHTVGPVFEYGTTTAYGSTAAGNPGMLSSPGTTAITGSLTGLLPSTTYHYRLRAGDYWNGGDFYYGADQTFTTPSNITALPATNVTDLGATLSGTIDTGGSAYILGIEFGTSLSYGMSAGFVSSQRDALNPNLITLTASPANLLPATTYHYRVRAQLGVNGPIFYGTDQSFTTGPAATPPSIQSVGSNPASSTSANVSATINSGSSAASVTIEYGLDTSYGSQVVPGPPVAINTSGYSSATLTGLSASTTYHFRFKAVNNEGTATGADNTFTTLPPPTVTTRPASNVGSGAATLNGTYNPQGGAYTATFEYGTTTAYGSTVSPLGLVLGGGGGIVIGGGGGIVIGGGGGIVIGGGGGVIIGGGGGGGGGFVGGTTPQDVSATAGSLLAATTYHYRLKLTDNAGTSYTGDDATFTTVSQVEAWRQSYFGSPGNSGDGADDAIPLGDGMKNLLKYALGLDPTKPGTPPTPGTSIHPTDGSTRLSLTFTRLLAATDVLLEVQAADSLAGPWTTIAHGAGNGPFVADPFPEGDQGLVESTTPFFILPNSTGTVTVRDSVPITGATQRFMRLKVTR